MMVLNTISLGDTKVKLLVRNMVFFHICGEAKLVTLNITMKQNVFTFTHIMDVK
jgi:hypothetical protein